jgi:hypothetical protein
MRLTVFFAAWLISPSSVWAQTAPCADAVSVLLKSDPYKPSDAAIVRNYGPTVLAQASLEALLRLDPYVPSQAALLRQVGGAIPVWPYAMVPVYPDIVPPRPPRDSECGPSRVHDNRAAAPTTFTTLDEVLAVLKRAPALPPPARRAGADRNQGISIHYDGRTWRSAGPAVRVDAAGFVRVGESAGLPIFRRAGEKDDVVYVPTTPGVVAPFRAVAR